jgi:hypothetical protein
MTADPELGLVYVPVELPTGDYYGGHRPGAGLFGESLVALDVKTGQRKWHYQLVHHGIWDMDIPGPPTLADITVNGRTIKAIAQPTKQAWLYVFDRATGQPVWPIEERPVAKGDVPGEWYSPTQPFVTKPPAFDRQGLSEDDLVDFTPELHAEALRIAKNYKLGPLFTPPVAASGLVRWRPSLCQDPLAARTGWVARSIRRRTTTTSTRSPNHGPSVLCPAIRRARRISATCRVRREIRTQLRRKAGGAPAAEAVVMAKAVGVG